MIKTQLQSRTSFDALDVMKWLCSIMVVIIHCNPLRPYSYTADVYTAQGFCRFAVPFFYAATGFLLFRKMQSPEKENKIHNRTIVIKYCKHIFVLYLIWSIIYFLPAAIRAGGIDFRLILQYCQDFFLRASYYPFWYLLASIYAIPLAMFLFHKPKWVTIIYCIIAWLLQCLRFTYDWVGLFELSPLSWITLHAEAFWNTLCCAVPLILIGISCINSYSRRSSKSWLLRFLLAGIGYFAELTLVYLLSPQKVHFEYLLCTPIVTYYLLNWLLSCDLSFRNRQIPQFLRLSSTWIYCVHVLIIEIYSLIHPSEGPRRFLVVLGISILSSIAYIFVKTRSNKTCV